MFYNVLKLKELVDLDKGEKFDKYVLLENDGASLCAMSIKKDETLDWHESNRDACAFVYEGKAEFHFTAEKFEVNKGELIMFKKGDTHKVYAHEDTKFLLIRI